MEKVLPKKALKQWVRSLDAFTVYIPVERDGILSFEVLGDKGVINLDYQDVVVPSKQVVFPRNETLLGFYSDNDTGIKLEETTTGEGHVIVFGVRPCSGRGIWLLDKVFGGDIEDRYYSGRRENTVVVGLTCNEPMPNCFCTSVGGSPYSKEGFDLLLTDLSDNYFIETITSRGDEIVNQADEFFAEPTPETKKHVNEVRKTGESKLRIQIDDVEGLRDHLADKFDSPYWEDSARSCIGCGVCTYLCPTCHCFDINDEIVSSEPLKGRRVRTWDNCQFPDFTMHSSGHNPRPNKGSRLRQRVFHKFKYFPDRYEESQCTGCGRCISMCPVGINILDVVNNVG
ncbi:MAG: 4Fe-4S dicluster domain-containing protein [bacterium]|nr:4Fe-4S dicluster domain-containing protein [bacterium]